MPTDELLLPPDHEPELPHEYQFVFEFEEAQWAFDRMIEHLDLHTDHERG